MSLSLTASSVVLSWIKIVFPTNMGDPLSSKNESFFGGGGKKSKPSKS